MNKKNLVFLYTRLADYFYQCLLYFAKRNKELNVIVIRYDADKNAPFQFHETDNLKLFYKSNFSGVSDILDFLKPINPLCIYCTGWGDKEYLQVISKLKNTCPTILGLDNPWESTIRQKLGVLYFKLFIKSIFSHIWVAGIPQYLFAKRLGFKDNEILNELYCANTESFLDAGIKTKRIKKTNFPRKLVFIGRYVTYKQPLILVRLFKNLEDSGLTNGWCLELIGSGPLKEILYQYNSETILINDFIKPNDLPEKLASSGAFCLPSKGEHWGVVVHEAASAGLALLLSNTVYSGSSFLIDAYNGFKFDENNKNEMKESLLNLFSKSEDELLNMGYNSMKLAQRINHETWSANLNSVLKK